jgi:hypothetical protein
MNKYYTLEYPKNNIFNEDSRNNQKLVNKSSLDSNWKYRQYMQQNANNIMKYNTMQSISSSGNNPYTNANAYTNAYTNTNKSVHLYSSTHDNNNPNGYKYSDLKDEYLKKEQMKSRMISPNFAI